MMKKAKGEVNVKQAREELQTAKDNLEIVKEGITDRINHNHVVLVFAVPHAVNIPIIGMGGITNASDAIEMILAGATAVSVGTANFVNPKTTEQIVDGIAEYMDKYGVKDISELVGAVVLTVIVYRTLDGYALLEFFEMLYQKIGFQ